MTTTGPRYVLSARLWLMVSLAALATARFTAASWAEETEAKLEPLDFVSPPELLVATTRFAWCASLSPDEKWIAAGYGHWGGTDAGLVVVWDRDTSTPRWQAREERGVRSVAVSPGGDLVASGNFAGQIKIRDSQSGKLLRTFQQDRGSVERLCFSSTGKQLATSSNTTNLVRIWDAETGQVEKTLAGHTEVPYWVEFSPDDRLIVSAGRDRTVRLWNAQDGALLHTCDHPAEVSAAIFLLGGKQVASVAHDGLVRLWNVATGQLAAAWTPPEPRGAACAIAVSRNGKQLASGSASRVHLWNLASGETTATLEGHAGLVHGLAFDKLGQRLVSAAWDGSVRVWDLDRRQTIQSLPLPSGGNEPAGPIAALAHCPSRSLVAAAIGNAVELRSVTDGSLARRLEAHEDAVLAMAFSPDGTWLATAGADGVIHLCRISTGDAEVRLPHHTGAVHALAWSDEGDRLLSGGSDSAVRVFDTRTWKEIATLAGHAASVLAVATLPRGRAVSASEDGIVKVWDVAAKKEVALLLGHEGAVRAIAVDPQGASIATAGDDQSVKLWDAATFKLRASVGGHQQPVLCLAFSPQGKTLVSGAAGGGMHFLDPARGTVRRTTSKAHTGPLTGVAFLPGAAGILTAGEDQTIRLWRAAGPALAPLVSLPAHGESAFAAAFSPDGKWLATGGKDAIVALRDPMTGEIKRQLLGHSGIVYEVNFSPDGRLLATASSDGTVRNWSVATGEMLSSLKVWKDKFAGVRTVSFAPDNRTLIAGGGDGTLRLLDAVDKKPIKDLTGQALPVTGARFSPEGSLLATCSGDWQRWRLPGELRLWDAKSGEELASLAGHGGEIKRVAFSDSGRRLVSAGSGGGGTIVWDVAARKTIATLRTGVTPTAVTFLRDENLLAIGDAQGGVAIWDIGRRAVVRRYAGHDKLVSGISASPDGQRLATAGHDGTLKLWPLTDPASAAPAR